MKNDYLKEYTDTIEMSKKNIVRSVRTNFLLWPLLLVLIVVNKFIHNALLKIIIILIMVLMLIKVLQFGKFIKQYYKISFFDGPYPVQRRNTLVINRINIIIIGASIYLMGAEKGSWFVIPLIVLSFLCFFVIGAGFDQK